jgi:hypothetical protein
MGGACTTHGRTEKLIHTILVGEPEGRKPLGKPRRRWQYNVKMDLYGTGYEGEEWIHLARMETSWRVLENTVINVMVP